jgi:hypothetical protein
MWHGYQSIIKCPNIRLREYLFRRIKQNMKDTIWLVDLLFILVNPGIIVIPPFTLIILVNPGIIVIPLFTLIILVNPGIIVIPPFTLIILIGKIVDWLAVKRVRWNKSNCFQTIHDYKDSRSVTHNWPTFDEWRIWEHDHYFQRCQEKQAFCVMFLLFIYNVYVNSSYINNLHNSLVPSWSWWDGSWISDYLCNQCLSPLKLWVRITLRRCELGTTLCDKICQWLATGLVFSTYNTDRHDMTEILLK